MLRKRTHGATQVEDPSADESGSDDFDGEYDDGEYDPAGTADGETAYEDGEYEAEADESESDEEYEDGEYEDDVEGYEYEDDEEYEPEQDEDADEGDFIPPSAGGALRRALFPNAGRARPASGTPEEAERVNKLDTRERLIGGFLGVMVVALGVISSLAMRHYITPAHSALPKGQTALSYQKRVRGDAIWFFGITFGLGALVLGATAIRRRALLGFALLMAAFMLLQTGGLLFALIYFGTAIWLIFKAMSKSPKNAAANAARAEARAARTGRPAAGASTRTSRTRTPPTRTSPTSTGASSRASSSTTTTSTTATPKPTPGRAIGKNRRAESTTGRYTPPKPVRQAPPPPEPEPESSNRLSAWLKK